MSNRREQLVQGMLMAGRELSTAAVLFHTAMSERRGLSATEGKALDLLDRFGPLTARELAERSGLVPASVTGLVDRLEAKGAARRVPHPQDRRRILIELDREWVRQFDGLFDDFVKALLELSERYTDDQLDAVVDFMTRAAQAQQEATTRLTAE